MLKSNANPTERIFLTLSLIASFVALICFTLIPQSMTLSFKYNTVFKVACYIPIVTALLGLLLKKQICRKTPLSISNFLLLIALFVSCALSPLPQIAFTNLLIPIAGLSIGWLTFSFIRQSTDPKAALVIVLRTLALYFAITYVYSLIFFASRELFPSPENFLTALKNFIASFNAFPHHSLFPYNDNTAPFTHSNYTAGFALIGIPLFINLILCDKKIWKPLWLILSFLAFTELISAKSRGGQMGILAWVAFFCLAIVWIKKYPLKYIIPGVLLTFVVTLAVLCALYPSIRHLITVEIGQGTFSQYESTRWHFVLTGWSIAKHFLFSGSGIGTTPLVYPLFWTGVGQPNCFQLHSTPIQILSETGLFGCATILFISVVVTICTIKAAKSIVSLKDKLLFLTPLISVFTYCAFSITDFQLELYSIMGSIAILTASSAALLNPNTSKDFTSQSTLLAKICLVIIFATLTYFQIKDSLGRKFFYEAVRAPTLERMENLIIKAQETKDVVYFNQAGNIFARHWMQSFRQNEFFRRKAITYFKKSLQAWPHQSYPHISLGWLYLGHNNPRSTMHFKEGIGITQNHHGAHVGLCYSLLNQGKIDKALRALAIEICLLPISIAFNDIQWLLNRYPETMLLVKNLQNKIPLDERNHVLFLKWWNGAQLPPIKFPVYKNEWFYGLILNDCHQQRDKLLGGEGNQQEIRSLLLDQFILATAESNAIYLRDYFMTCSLAKNFKEPPLNRNLTKLPIMRKFSEIYPQTSKANRLPPGKIALFTNTFTSTIPLLLYRAFVAPSIETKRTLIFQALTSFPGCAPTREICDSLCQYLSMNNGSFLQLLRDSIYYTLPSLNITGTQTAFPILYRNSDGPPTTDLYAYNCNLFAWICLKSLFLNDLNGISAADAFHEKISKK
jgi:hypothetical protein